MISEITFTPNQLYGVIGVLAFLLGGVVLMRSVFNYAKLSDLEKLEVVIKAELERHSTARHEMRREISRMEMALVKVETQMVATVMNLKTIEGKVEDLPDKIFNRLKPNHQL